MNDADRGMPEHLEKKLSQCFFDQDWPGFEIKPQDDRPANNRLSPDTAQMKV